MIFSKHTIFSRIHGSTSYFILNLLHGQADILERAEGEEVERFLAGGELTPQLQHQLTEQGYFVDPTEEETLYKEKYLDFIDQRDDEEVQLFFVPNYSCNFGCSYCYQDEYAPASGTLTKEVIDAFFDYVRIKFADRRKYITIFGGEPLLPSSHQKELIHYFIEQSSRFGIEIAIVTNGYTLVDYIPILKSGSIREIQVTLDGTEMIHNQRRFLKNGGATFSEIVAGIDAALFTGFSINLRMVIDQQNIGNLADLARFAIDKGWTKNPLFKTQLGRNYELHHCQTDPSKLFSRITLYQELYQLIKVHPEIVEFHKPAYSITKYLSENGYLPDPLFDACPACKSEWAFDYTGQIYSCTATVGKSDEVLGSFYPEVTLREDLVQTWQDRDVLSIPECSTCGLQLACGSGCGSVAKNQTGKILSPDCRPVKELMGIGFAAYIENGDSHPEQKGNSCCCC